MKGSSCDKNFQFFFVPITEITTINIIKQLILENTAMSVQYTYRAIRWLYMEQFYLKIYMGTILSEKLKKNHLWDNIILDSTNTCVMLPEYVGEYNFNEIWQEQITSPIPQFGARITSPGLTRFNNLEYTTLANSITPCKLTARYRKI
jgi:hypothetical protein